MACLVAEETREEPVVSSQRKAKLIQTDNGPTHVKLGCQPGGSRIVGARSDAQMRPPHEVQGRQQGRISPVPARRPPRIRHALGDVASLLRLASLPASLPLDGRFRRQRWLHRRDTSRCCMTLYQRDPFPGGAKPPPDMSGPRYVPSKPSRRTLTISAAIGWFMCSSAVEMLG